MILFTCQTSVAIAKWVPGAMDVVISIVKTHINRLKVLTDPMFPGKHNCLYQETWIL